MEEPTDQLARSTSEPGIDSSSNEAVRGRFRRVFGFLGRWAFWKRLAAGLLILGAGVLIGLGISWFIDEELRSDEYDSRRGDHWMFEKDDRGGWMGRADRAGEKGGFGLPGMDGRFSAWDEDSDGWEKPGWEGGSGKKAWSSNGIYVPYEVLEMVERILARVERLVDRLSDFVDAGGLGEWDRSDSEGDYPDKDDEDSWWEESDGDPFGDLGVPFGRFLPSLALLEDCELEFDKLFGAFEEFDDLEGLAEEGLDDEDGMEGFFAGIEELLTEICEAPVNQ